MKKCNKCFLEKEISEFYGKQGDCKSCTKKRVREREELLRKDPEWNEKEKERSREKYHRLGYKDRHKPTPDEKREIIRRYKEKFPEKILAQSASQRMLKKEGNELHHWSYNAEHRKDVIEMSVIDHNKIHRYIVYDQERMMYRRSDNNELLDTKEAHIDYFNSLTNKS